MYGKSNELGTLLNAQMMCEKEDSPPQDSDCMTRMMTPEDWEKYGPLSTESKKTQKSKVI